MNEPKRRGRPPKALTKEELAGVDPIAAAFAARVWNGQSASLPLKVRIGRVVKALEKQNMLTTGISLPPIEVQE